MKLVQIEVQLVNDILVYIQNSTANVPQSIVDSLRARIMKLGDQLKEPSENGVQDAKT